MGKSLWSGNSATDERGQAPCACDLLSNGSWTGTCYISGDSDCRGHHQEVVANAGATASAGGSDTVRQGSPHPATDGNDMPTNAGGTGAIGGDWLGNLVTELASGRNSHGGGRCFAGPVIRFRRGVFFVRVFDPYDGPMPDSRWVVTVFTYGMAGGTHRRPGYPGTGSPSEAPGPADGKRRLIRGEGLVARISNDYRPQSQLLGRTFQDRRSRVMWGLPGC